MSSNLDSTLLESLRSQFYFTKPNASHIKSLSKLIAQGFPEKFQVSLGDNQERAETLLICYFDKNPQLLHNMIIAIKKENVLTLEFYQNERVFH